MSDFLYNTLYSALSDILIKKKSVKEVEKAIPGLLNVYQQIYPDESVDPEKLFRAVVKDYNVWVGDYTVLEDSRDHEEWLASEKASIEWDYTERYLKYLKTVKHFPQAAVDSVEESSGRILSLLESPRRKGSWDRRGMVVGSVQAGKTANYTALICKAIDAGYKVIVVLAGLNNDLRTQTQERIDEGVLGRDTSKERRLNQSNTLIGVGRLAGARPKILVHAYTNSTLGGDFKSSTYKKTTVTPGGDPFIVVVKKNTTPLRNLVNWFSGQYESNKIADVPMLLIDDEADNASIDTNAINKLDPDNDAEEHDPTKINGLIRQLLNTFSQSAYVGYTATPFANIFIYPEESEHLKKEYGEDLFPRSFIVNLKAPSNYFGPERLFGLEKDTLVGIEEEVRPLPLIRKINDYSSYFPEHHDKTLRINGLPDSLKQAIYAFILSNAVCAIRGQEAKHHSMLVHVTRYVDVQLKIVAKIQEFLKNIVELLQAGTTPKYDCLLNELSTLWKSDFKPTSIEVFNSVGDDVEIVSWEEVSKYLYKVASKIEVKAVNGRAKDGGLNYKSYPQGCSVIAVGGDKLSRGLTLDGLSISYYTRATKMYDTLMQMGRWFGYRNGYLDVCRLYTTADLIKHYRHITVADYELRQELENMGKLHATPENYGLKVRTDPEGALLITARNKMRNSEQRVVSYSGKLVQLTHFHRQDRSNSSNQQFTNDWIASLGAVSSVNNSYIWRSVNAEQVIEFVKNIQIHPDCFTADPNVVTRYIRKLNSDGELLDWTVALISSSKSTEKAIVGGCPVGLSWRTDATPDEESLSIISNQLIKESDESIDLSDEEIKRAMETTLNNFHPTPKRPTPPSSPSPAVVRQVRSPKQALLLIYVFKSGTKDQNNIIDAVYDDTYLGYAISFPQSSKAGKVVYMVDKTYIDREFGDDF